jgi:hypothetical protein
MAKFVFDDELPFREHRTSDETISHNDPSQWKESASYNSTMRCDEIVSSDGDLVYSGSISPDKNLLYSEHIPSDETPSWEDILPWDDDIPYNEGISGENLICDECYTLHTDRNGLIEVSSCETSKFSLGYCYLKYICANKCSFKCVSCQNIFADVNIMKKFMSYKSFSTNQNSTLRDEIFICATCAETLPDSGTKLCPASSQ